MNASLHADDRNRVIPFSDGTENKPSVMTRGRGDRKSRKLPIGNLRLNVNMSGKAAKPGSQGQCHLRNHLCFFTDCLDNVCNLLVHYPALSF